MHNLVDVQICQTTQDLGTNVLCWLYDVRSVGLSEVGFHVFSVQHFDESVELEVPGGAVVFVHEILVIDHVWVLEVFTDVEFCEHLAKLFLCLFLIA